MKKLLSFLSLMLLACTVSVHASSNSSYYYHGKQVSLPVDLNSFFISAATDVDLSAVFRKYGYTIEVLQQGRDANALAPVLYWKVVRVTNATLKEAAYNSLRQRLKTDNALLACPVLGEEHIAVSNYFYVKLRSREDMAALDVLAKQTGVLVLPALSHLPLWVPVATGAASRGNSLELANYFYETGKFDMVSPDFMIPVKRTCTTDPDFSQQWGMKNTAYPGVDIRACDAWLKTKGSSSVKVAFVDDGINGTQFGGPAAQEFAGSNLVHYDTDSGHTVPYHVYPGYHATPVAAILAANHNTSYISGVAPLSSILDVKFVADPLPQEGARIADGMAWARDNGAAIMNCSWKFLATGYPLQVQLLEDAIDDAIANGRGGLGTLMVFAAGNDYGPMAYPAVYRPEILAVGGIAKDGTRADFASYGSKLDVVAPAKDIATLGGAGTYLDWGTSLAAPSVSGAAALALAVNPCLSEEELRNIIEYSAQKVSSGTYAYGNNMYRPNGTWNNEMGYGLLDAKRVVDIADSMKKNTADLYIKDRPYDFGIEPNSDTGPCWISDDIWIRLLNDDTLQHQNPPPGQLVFIKVKIRNKSCAASEPSTLKVYWAKASTGLAWPAPWDGSAGPGIGGTLMVSVPAIQGGHDYIATIPWVTPNTGMFNHHFCLMAETVLAGDPLRYNPAGGDLGRFVRENNNVAQKNITIMNAVYGTAFVTAGSFGNDAVSGGNLAFRTQPGESGIPVTAAAEVRIALSAELWNKWQQGGALGQGFRVVDEANHELLALQPSLMLRNLHFNPGEVSGVRLKVNFLTDVPAGDKTGFVYDLVQQDNQGVSRGGERFQITRPGRTDMFQAQGTAQQQQSQVTLTAVSIGEPATYTWFTADTTFVDSGIVVHTPVTGATAYLLQVTAHADGFRDYAQVTVAGAAGQISGLSPNPATTGVTVLYQLPAGIQTAQLKITSVNSPGMVLASVNINPGGTQAVIPLQNLPAGVYVVSLYGNNQLKDSKQLVKQ